MIVRLVTCTKNGVPEETRRDSAADPAAANVRAIIDLERRAVRDIPFTDRLSERISRVAGSLGFAVFHVVTFISWAAWNALATPRWRFDHYPYGLLTFIVSLEGVLVATFVLIAQNRMSQQSNDRAQLDLQVNLLAEQEMTLMLRMLGRISERLGIPPESEEAERAEKLAEETNVYQLMERIKQESPEPTPGAR